MLLEFQLSVNPEQNFSRLGIFYQFSLISCCINVQRLSRLQQVSIIYGSRRFHSYRTLQQSSHYPILFFTCPYIKLCTQHTGLNMLSINNERSMLITSHLKISFTRQINLTIRTPERITVNKLRRCIQPNLTTVRKYCLRSLSAGSHHCIIRKFIGKQSPRNSTCENKTCQKSGCRGRIMSPSNRYTSSLGFFLLFTYERLKLRQ